MYSLILDRERTATNVHINFGFFPCSCWEIWVPFDDGDYVMFCRLPSSRYSIDDIDELLDLDEILGMTDEQIYSHLFDKLRDID